MVSGMRSSSGGVSAIMQPSSQRLSDGICRMDGGTAGYFLPAIPWGSNAASRISLFSQHVLSTLL